MVDDRNAAISLRSVTKQYPGAAAPAVDSLSIDISAGEIVVLLGPSGCGKTTTLKMINRLIEPTSGTIEVLGEDNRSMPAPVLRRKIGYVIQQIGLFPHQSIRRNISAVPELLGWDRRMIDERCAEVVELVGLEAGLLDRYPSELSGGQQQRVGVARALAADPPILLMDEPYSAVDPVVRQRLQDELLDLQGRLGKTIVLVTHDVDEAIRLADRIAVFNTRGVVEQCDSPELVLRQPASEFVAGFLGRERGLRRLALLTVGQLDPTDDHVIGTGTAAAAAVSRAEAAGLTWVAVTDGERLLGRATISDIADISDRLDIDLPSGGISIAELLAAGLELRDFRAVVSPATSAREALDILISTSSDTAVVIDGNRFCGMISVQQIAEGLE